jgi:hypothetical protein
VICVPQHISEIDHLLPIDCRLRLLDLFREPFRGFAHDLQQPLCCQAHHRVGSKLLQTPALNHLLDCRDRLRDIQ